MSMPPLTQIRKRAKILRTHELILDRRLNENAARERGETNALNTCACPPGMAVAKIRAEKARIKLLDEQIKYKRKEIGRELVRSGQSPAYKRLAIVLDRMMEERKKLQPKDRALKDKSR